MCFFFGKFISEIHEHSEKSEKFNSSLWMRKLLLATHRIQQTHLRLTLSENLKHIILEIFWPETSETD